MEIVTVQYWKEWLHGYSGRNYTYRTTLHLQVGDRVLAPTAKGDRQKAIVTQTGLPESVIDPSWADRVLTITEMDNGEVPE